VKILYSDNEIIVCVKPSGVLSTDEPGGMPDLIRQELGEPEAKIRSVHRLDRVVSGIMVYARTARAASEISRQIREDLFHKKYFAVVHGMTPDKGEMFDLLTRDKAERKTYVTNVPGKESREAKLFFQTIARSEQMSLVQIQLVTGRTHQIRCQFSSRAFPIVGDRKYSVLEDDCDIALWSGIISFNHPKNGERLEFRAMHEAVYPWNVFAEFPQVEFFRSM